MLMARSQPWAKPATGSQFLRRCYSAEAAQEESSAPALTVEDMMPVENIRNIAIIGECWLTIYSEYHNKSEASHFPIPHLVIQC
jgi:hypothetical protein